MVVDAPALPQKRIPPGAISIAKNGMQAPIHAWTLVADDNELNMDYGPFYGEKDEKKKIKPVTEKRDEKPNNKWVKWFHRVFLCYGIDLSCNITGCGKRFLWILRKVYFLVSLFLIGSHWLHISCSLKTEYIEYGATLINMVFSARLVSGIIAHNIMNNRSEKTAKLLKTFDEISNTVSFEKPQLRDIRLCFIVGFIGNLMYCGFPVKYNSGEPPSNSSDPDWNVEESIPYRIHIMSMLVLDNILTNIITFYILFYDVVALTFFAAFTARFYVVFRDAPFCRWLENGSKHEIGIVMKKFREHHYRVCRVVEDVDIVFAPTVLIWYVYMTTAMCCWIRAISTPVFADPYGIVTVLVCLIFALTEFYLVSVSTALVNDEVTAHLDCIRLMCINEETDFSTSQTIIEDRVNHLSYVTCVLASPVCITGWGFFTVSKEFVLTVSSTVLTFTLVLYGV